MKISILSSDARHPVVPSLRAWQRDMQGRGQEVVLFFDKAELTGGDLLFLVSCHDRVTAAERGRFRASLVLHASDLPQGRGWSPHVWAIAGGSSEITLCLIEAADPIDSGRIWLRSRFTLQGHELLPEINAVLFRHQLDLMTQAVLRFGAIEPVEQAGAPGRPLRRRTPEDSRLDVNRTIAEQFDLLRIVDNERYPAFFDHRGKRYLIKIEKAENAS